MIKIIRFLVQTIGIGVVAGVLLVLVYPEIRSPRQLSNQPTELPKLDPRNAESPVVSTTPITSFAEAVRTAAPAVTNIYSSKVVRREVNPFFQDPVFRHFFRDSPLFAPQERTQSSLGSGVVVRADGYLLTNNHVIAGADEVRVALHDGRTVVAEVVGTDPDTDLAVLKVALDNLPYVRFGNSDGVSVGDLVLAIGNPFGVGQTVTMGIVSATGRQNLGINTYENFIQTDAAINPGNSGGALVDTNGSLIGINTAIYSRSGGSLGIGFAVPSKLADHVLTSVIDHGGVIRGWLGIAVQDVRGEVAASLGLGGQPGIVITALARGGPGMVGGLRPGDAITHIDDKAVSSGNETLNQIAALAPGSFVRVRVLRNGRPLSVELQVAVRAVGNNGG